MAVARCVFCNHVLPAAQMAVGSEVVCAGCHKPSAVIALPALLVDGRPKPPPLIEPPGEGEVVCFYSPNRKATHECSHCGVLISDVWAAQWGSKSVCLKCLEHLREKGKDVGFQGSRLLWDNITLATALVPFTLVFYWATFITAPASVFLGFWHWNSPRSLVPRSRLRLMVGLLLGLLQITAAVLLVCGLWFGWFTNGTAS